MDDAISALCVQANVLQDDRIKAQHHHFIEACHDLDLFRCYGGDRMEDKVKKLAALVVSTDVADLLALSAEQAIAATGDRLMYSRSMDTRQYDAAAFPICSKQPKECLDAIMGVFGPVLSSLCDGKISKVLPPTPLVPGESKVRFAGSRFMLLHKAQMAMWKELKWETAEEFEQCNAMLRTLKELLSKYCAAKGVAWVHADGDDGRGKKFFDALVAVARTETRPHRMCERLWTSPETLKHPGGKERELCSIVNDVIRDDDRSNEGSTDSPSLLAPATAFVCMLQFHLNAGRRKKNSHTKWPDGSNSDEKETVFRGSGLPVVHPVTGAPVQGFFRALAGQDQWYRVPHPLATSFRKRVMSTFLGIVHSNDPAMPLVEWTIRFDATKERPPHVNFLDKTEVPSAAAHPWLTPTEPLFRRQSFYTHIAIAAPQSLPTGGRRGGAALLCLRGLPGARIPPAKERRRRQPRGSLPHHTRGALRQCDGLREYTVRAMALMSPRACGGSRSAYMMAYIDGLQ